MSRSSPSRSEDLSEDEIDVSYEVEMPFEGRNARINLIDRDDEVEIIVSQIPAPDGYHQNYKPQRQEPEKLKQHGVARWIVKDSARVLERYDWLPSSRKANSGNRYLRDVYFTCERDEVDEAVMNCKKFLTRIEENVFYHSQEHGVDFRNPPSEVIDSE